MVRYFVKSGKKAAYFCGTCIATSVLLIHIAWSCQPLVIFVAGAGESTFNKRIMEAVYTRESNRLRDMFGSSVRTELFGWNESARIQITVERQWKSTKNRTPIFLIGYSYGGDTAYRVAGRLPKGYAPILVALDPVGEQAWWSFDDCWALPLCLGFMLTGVNAAIRDGNLSKPTTGKWFHTFNPVDDFYVYNHWVQLAAIATGKCDAVAWVGGPYGYQSQATKSVEYVGGHCNIAGLYEKVGLYIESEIKLRCKP